MAYQMATAVVALNDLEGHSSVAGLFKCNPSTFVQHFTRFQLTACSRGSSALAGLLVHTTHGPRLSSKFVAPG